MQLLLKNFHNEKINKLNFRNDINSLRAIAVLGVVFYHADIKYFQGGWLGVDIFFVISGYLISNNILYALQSGNFSLTNFYLKRIRRLIPALLLTLLISLFFGFVLLSPKAMQEFLNSLFSSLFFVSNYYFQNLDFYAAESAKFMPLLHLWSLSIEEQFYIIFPFICIFLFKNKRKYFLLAIIFLISISVFLNILNNDPLKFYKIQFRAWELLLGTLVMLINQKIKVKNFEIFGLSLIVFSYIIFDDIWINNLEPKLIALAGASLFILSKNSNSILNKLHKSKLFVYIGLSSYSIYLFHQPIFAFARIYKLNSWDNILKSETNLTIFDNISLIIITLFLGYFSYIKVEKKYLLKKFKLKSLILPFLFVISLSLYLNVNFVDIKFQNIPHKVVEFSSDKNLQKIYKDEKNCHNPTLDTICFFDNKKNKNVFILGDSHLMNLNTLVKESKNNDYNLTILTFGGCQFVFDEKFREDDCKSIPKSKLDNLINNISDSIIIYGGRLPLHLSESRFFNGYVNEPGVYGKSNNFSFNEKKNLIVKTLNKLTDNGNKLILIYPIPEQGWNVPNLYINNSLNWNDDVGYSVEVYDSRTKSSYQVLNSVDSVNIYRVFPKNIFCNTFIDNKCAGKFGNQIFYFDDDHLSRDGEVLLSQEILKLINKID